MSLNSDSDSDGDSDDDFVVLVAAYLLSKKRSRPRKPRVDNSALPEHPKTGSTWARIRANGSDELLVTLLSIDRRAFDALLTPFTTEWRQRDACGKRLHRKKLRASVRKNRRVMTADGCLGLTLMYLSSKSELKYIGLLFGINEVRARSYCRLGMKLLNKVYWISRCGMSCFASALTLSPLVLVLYSLYA